MIWVKVRCSTYKRSGPWMLRVRFVVLRCGGVGHSGNLTQWEFPLALKAIHPNDTRRPHGGACRS